MRNTPYSQQRGANCFFTGLDGLARIFVSFDDFTRLPVIFPQDSLPISRRFSYESSKRICASSTDWMFL